jgi:hypothetical protein
VGLAAADAAQNEVDGSLLRWTLCHSLLLGGKKPGFTVQDFIDLVQEVMLCMGFLRRKHASPGKLSLFLQSWQTMTPTSCHSVEVKRLMHACMQASLCRRMVKSWAATDEGIMNHSCQQEHYIFKSLGVAALLRAKVARCMQP